MKEHGVVWHPIEPKSTKPNGQYQVGTHDIAPLLGFESMVTSLVVIPPNQAAGNHAHSRLEAFVGTGLGLHIYWLDEKGSLHTEAMNPEGQPRLFKIGSEVPHAIENKADTHASLIEFTSMPYVDSSYRQVHVIDIPS